MGQEYFINSEDLEAKVRQLLPSQGGAGAGVDLSASTQIVPIIDLTESAQGSNLRQDLQTSLSFDTITEFLVNATASTLVTTTGYFRVFGMFAIQTTTAGGTTALFQINDGASAKGIVNFADVGSNTDKQAHFVPFDFNVFLNAGDRLDISCGTGVIATGCTRQIASIDGTLTNP